MKLTFVSGSGFPLNSRVTLIAWPGPMGATGFASGTSSNAWPSGFSKPVQSLFTLSKLGLARKYAFALRTDRTCFPWLTIESELCEATYNPGALVANFAVWNPSFGA